jgi:acetyl esterase/lipase
MEGHDVARWLVARGIAAFVLKYRLIATDLDEDGFKNQISDLRARLDEIQKIIPHSVEDGRQAIRLVRQHAFSWAIDPNRIGILGFSAGGMVTSGVALEHDAASRPNFAAPIYGAPFEAVTAPADPPPLFLLVANDDRMAEQGIMRLYSAWNEAGRSVELHVYSRGGHGFGMQQKGLPTDHWIERFADWLTAEGFVPPAG